MLGLSPTAKVAFHASNLKPAKRLLDLVASAVAVVKQDAEIVHLIVGTGPERVPLDQACRERGVERCVRFIGRIDHARMPDHLALADMVIMPSSREGLSLGCLEAMACGRLVIASDIPASREVIRDGETGLLFRMGDVHDLAAKTLLAARDPELRARVGRAARAYVEAHHRVEDMVDRYETALEDLVERDRRSVEERGGDIARRDGGPAGCSRVDDRAKEPM